MKTLKLGVPKQLIPGVRPSTHLFHYGTKYCEYATAFPILLYQVIPLLDA